MTDPYPTASHPKRSRIMSIARGADVVLIDPQYAPKVIAQPEIEDMVALISSAAAQEKVDVFHRFALPGHAVVSL